MCVFISAKSPVCNQYDSLRPPPAEQTRGPKWAAPGSAATAAWFRSAKGTQIGRVSGGWCLKSGGFGQWLRANGVLRLRLNSKGTAFLGVLGGAHEQAADYAALVTAVALVPAFARRRGTSGQDKAVGQRSSALHSNAGRIMPSSAYGSARWSSPSRLLTSSAKGEPVVVSITSRPWLQRAGPGDGYIDSTIETFDVLVQ
jgi:hypothetical protein